MLDVIFITPPPLYATPLMPLRHYAYAIYFVTITPRHIIVTFITPPWLHIAAADFITPSYVTPFNIAMPPPPYLLPPPYAIIIVSFDYADARCRRFCFHYFRCHYFYGH